MKKLVLTNTILFFIVVLFVVAFQSLFGADNSIIAVMSITGLLMFLGSDLTAEPLKNALDLAFLYVLIGVGAFIASTNIYLAIPINFIVIFIISMKFCHILKSPMYVPFTLLYLFLLTDTVSPHEFPLRIMALIAGALSIMIPQFLVNKNKIKKSSNIIIKDYIETLIKKLTLISKKENYTELTNETTNLANKLKAIIYDKKEKGFYLSEEGKKSLDLLVSLEKLNFLIEKSSLSTMSIPLSQIQDFLNILLNDLTKFNKDALEEFVDKLENDTKATTNFLDIRILTSFISIKLAFEDYNSSVTISSKKKSKNLKEDLFLLKDIKMNSIKLKYSLRLGIGIAFACFIMQFFDLHQGKWIMYTIVSLTTPFFEATKSKTKDRLIATIIGAILIAVLFTIFKQDTIRQILVLFIGYINMYCKSYRHQMFVVTLSAVGAASLVSSGSIIGNYGHITPISMAVMRVSFIIIGAILAFILNKYLFYCNVSKANHNLEEISFNIVDKVYDNLDIIVNKPNLDDFINNSYLLVSQIEKTIFENDTKYGTNSFNKVYEENSTIKIMIISSTYELKKFLSQYELKEADFKAINKLISQLKSLDTKFTSIDFSTLSNTNSKIVIGYILGIKESMKLINSNNSLII